MNYSEQNLIYPLVKSNDPILHQQIPVFDFTNPSEDPNKIAHILSQSLLHYDGLGLAAPQLGLEYRAFCIKAQPMIVCFNPKIVDQSDNLIYLDEGCLSFPNLFIKIKRPDAIKVRYTQPNGEVITTKFQGMTCRVFQHELNHLDGITFQSKASKIHLERARNHQRKLAKQS